MSKCISMHGEYSEHELDRDFICARCNALDEDALIADRDAALARAERADGWIDELAQAAGFGPIAAVAQHQRDRGLDGDHEARLNGKRVARLKAIVMEEAEWRSQILFEFQERAERAEAQVQAVRDLHRDDYFDPPHCEECSVPMPCSTLDALDAPADTGSQP